MGLSGDISKQEDIVVSIGIAIRDAKDAFKTLKGTIKREVKAIQGLMSTNKMTFDVDTAPLRKNLQEIKNKIKTLRLDKSLDKDTRQERINPLQKAGFNIEKELQQKRAALDKTLIGNKKDLMNAQTRLSSATTKFNKNQAKLNTTLNEGKDKLRGMVKQSKAAKFQFQGWAMSMMFFGMALKRAFDMIWKSSSRTFQDVMHSTEGTVTGFDRLDSSMKLLGYTAGAALEPIADFLIPIIDKISTLISGNETFFAILTAGLGVFGVLFGTGGMIILAINGMAEFATKIGLAKINADGLFKMDWKALGTKINKGIGLVSIIWAFQSAKAAYDDFSKGNVADGILNSLQAGAFGAAFFIKNPYVRTALFAVGVSLELVEQNVFMKTIMSTLGLVGAAFSTLWSFVAYEFRNLVALETTSMLKKLIDKIATAWLKINPMSLTAHSLKYFANTSFGEVNEDPFDFMKSFEEHYKDGIIFGEHMDDLIENFKNEIDFKIKFPDKEFDEIEYRIKSLANFWTGENKDSDLARSSATDDLDFLTEYGRYFNIDPAVWENINTIIAEMKNNIEEITRSDLQQGFTDKFLGLKEFQDILSRPEMLTDNAYKYVQDMIKYLSETHGETSEEKQIIIENLEVHGITNLDDLLTRIEELT